MHRLKSVLRGIRDRVALFGRLPLPARLYVAAVIGCGLVIFFSRRPDHFDRPWLTLLFLVVSVTLANFKIVLPLANSRATMTLGHAPDFVAILLLGPDVAMAIGTTSVWWQCTFRTKLPQAPHQTLFSMGSIVLTIQTVGVALGWMGTGHDLSELGPAVQSLSFAAAVYFGINTVLVAGAIALSTRSGVWYVWQRDFMWSAPGYFLSAAAAGGSAWALRSGQLWTIPLVALPMYLTYRSYSMYLGRMEDQRRHAEELATLHNAALEALQRATTSEQALAAEKAQLELEKQRLAVTLGNIHDGVITTDVTGCVLLMNQAAEGLLAGVQRQDDGGCVNIVELLERLDLKPPRSFGETVQRVLAGESMRLVDRATLTAPDGEKRIDATGNPMRDRDGNVVGAVFVLRDVTDATQLEQERARATQLESLGVLAGGLAHDFNNLLTGIVGNISLARFNDDNEEVAERLQEAEAACQRARSITSQLLTFSNGGAPVKTTAWLGDLVKETSAFALRGSRLAPRFVIPMDLAPVDIDVGQMGQVLHNLVLNAQQATPGGGTVTVSLENVTVTREEWHDGTLIHPGRYVTVSVRDHGVGISPENLARIFDPYFTTKKTGSGLGLAVCYSIVTAHGGYLTVRSELGVGTCFTIFLPASSRRPAAKPAAGPAVKLSAGGRVLIMDDEPTIRDVASRMFRKLGYDPVVSAHGEEAIELVRQANEEGRRFEMVVMDLTVPGGMGGKDACPIIKRLDPNIKAIVSSGYADDPVMANHEQYGFDGVMGKPYILSDMRQALGAVTGAKELVAVAS